MNDFNYIYMGQWNPNSRNLAIQDRLQKYYDDTPDCMSNNDAKVHWKSFIGWCKENGYSREDINNAKKARQYRM